MTSLIAANLARVSGGVSPSTVLTGVAIVGSWLGVGVLGKIEWDVEHGRGPVWAQKAHDDRLNQLSAEARARHAGQTPGCRR